MANAHGRIAVRCFWLLISLLAPAFAHSQECPGSGASLTAVHNAISDLQKNDRSPAGADCAYGWAKNFDLASSKLDSVALTFFRAAADVHRRAAEKRYEAGQAADGDKYLNQEIVLRQSFLKEVLGRDVTGSTSPELRSHIVQHLSYLVSGLAKLRQYDKVAEDLGGRDPSVIDNEALKVWLQAVWSCARWDGNKANPCTDDNRQQCKEKIEVFLESVEVLKNRPFPPQTRRDIDALKRLGSTGRCLK